MARVGHAAGCTTTLPSRGVSAERAARYPARGRAQLIRAARQSSRGKHIARFILVGLYTGTRKCAILGLRFMPHTSGGWIDTERGLLYRCADGTRETKKRQPLASLPRRLLTHLHRWEARRALGDRISRRAPRRHQDRMGRHRRGSRNAGRDPAHPAAHRDYVGHAAWGEGLGCGQLFRGVNPDH